VAKTLNGHLMPNIQVKVEQNADQEEYRRLLETHLRGCGVQHSVVAQKLSSSLTPSELGDLVRRNEPVLLANKGNINADQARKVIGELSNVEKLMDLEVVDLDDLPRIDLSDNGVYKNSSELSTGQKCTAILPILLFDSANPLLIDQPEDNLDNRYVYECVVDTVRKVKGSRQLIFVTHNPNIPVLGDSEQVIVLHSDGRSGTVQKTGNVDDCRDEIINLLEGGADAFRLRSKRYDVK
jgi:ATPase subunit of ABC transporter with duplicated ATPase domains